MGWIIEIAKLLPVCLGTAFVLAVAMMLFPTGNAKATGLNVVFALTGYRLAFVGVLNVLIGLVLSRLTVVGDTAGRWHWHLR